MKPPRHSGGYPKSKMHQRPGNITLLTQVLHLLLCSLISCCFAYSKHQYFSPPIMMDIASLGKLNNDKYYQKNCKCGYLQSSQYIFQQKLGVTFLYLERNNNNDNDDDDDDDDNDNNNGLFNRSNQSNRSNQLFIVKGIQQWFWEKGVGVCRGRG